MLRLSLFLAIAASTADAFSPSLGLGLRASKIAIAATGRAAAPRFSSDDALSRPHRSLASSLPLPLVAQGSGAASHMREPGACPLSVGMCGGGACGRGRGEGRRE